MADILSTISGQFGKSLIFGALLPATIFVIFLIIFISPVYTIEWDNLSPLGVLGTEWKLIVVAFIIILISGLLFNFSGPIIRFYEGYPWENSLLGKRLKKIHQARFDRFNAHEEGLYTLRSRLKVDHRHYDKISRLYNDAGAALNFEYPNNRHAVLPTRLGNVIRSFERYPSHQYGMESIDLWPRLVAVIEASYAAQIDDSKTSLIFLLNLSFLSGLLSIFLLLVGLVHLPVNFMTVVILPALGFALAAYWFYFISIRQASKWGNLVKGAFDLYRFDLLKKLGYTQMPKTKRQERDLWRKITLQIIYSDEQVAPGKRKPYIDYSIPSTPFYQTIPEGIDLEITRGLRNHGRDGKITVVIAVRNSDQQKRTAESISITDAPPRDLDYEWGSARARGGRLSVSGSNPYRFSLHREVAFNKQVQISYRAVPYKRRQEV